jgi:hypothetical protein
MVHMLAGFLAYCTLGALAIPLWQRLWLRRHGIIV